MVKLISIQCRFIYAGKVRCITSGRKCLHDKKAVCARLGDHDDMVIVTIGEKVDNQFIDTKELGPVFIGNLRKLEASDDPELTPGRLIKPEAIVVTNMDGTVFMELIDDGGDENKMQPLKLEGFIFIKDKWVQCLKLIVAVAIIDRMSILMVKEKGTGQYSLPYSLDKAGCDNLLQVAKEHTIPSVSSHEVGQSLFTDELKHLSIEKLAIAEINNGDWVESIISNGALYSCNYISGVIKPHSENIELEWVFYKDLLKIDINPLHKPFIPFLTDLKP